MKQSTLKQLYKEQVLPKLKEKFGYKNVHQVPQLKKIILSMGLSKALKDKGLVESAQQDLMMLSGQKPIFTKAKKSVSNFKLREGQEIGLKVTLRGDRMFEFFYRLIHINFPRITDFRGFKYRGDGKGSYSLGLDDQYIFYEVNLDQSKHAQGMNITFVTSAVNDAECLALLSELGMPFKAKKSN